MTTASKPTITIETTTNVWDIFDIVQPLAGHAVVAHAGGVRRRGRESSYPLSPRSDPGVRNYRTGLFRDTRLRRITYMATHCMFPAVRLAQMPGPTCPDCVSFASCVSLSAPSSCFRVL